MEDTWTCGCNMMRTLEILLIPAPIWNRPIWNIEIGWLLIKNNSHIYIHSVFTFENLFFSRLRQTYTNNKNCIELGAFLLKSLVDKFISLSDKWLANFLPKQLRRIQLVCWLMITIIIKWKCYMPSLCFFYCFYKAQT